MTNRLKLIRDERGISQVALAQSSGVSLRQIQNIEAGAQPRMNTANLLARALSVSIADLFDTEGGVGMTTDGMVAMVERATEAQRAIIVARAYDALVKIRRVLKDENNIKLRGLTHDQWESLRAAADGLDEVLP